MFEDAKEEHELDLELIVLGRCSKKKSKREDTEVARSETGNNKGKDRNDQRRDIYIYIRASGGAATKVM